MPFGTRKVQLGGHDVYTTRREMLMAGAGAFGAAVLVDRARAGEATSEPTSRPIQCLDYGRSFICNSASMNAVRFWVESRTTLTDEKTGQSTVYYQCGACKSEDTFAPKDLFQKDNYDFLPILGGDEWLIFRRRAWLNPNYRSIAKIEKLWGKPILKLREAREVVELTTWEQIRDATAAAIPIVTQTEIVGPEAGLKAVIECPTKTMNISLDRKLYQVDTGPIAFPDLSKRYDPQIDCLSLAFIAFNAPDFADFVVEQPTPATNDGKDTPQVYHYSKPFSLKAKNRVLALGTL
jgi:hypothetical protein